MTTHWWGITLVAISSLIAGLGPTFLKRGSDNFDLKDLFKLKLKKLVKNKNLVKGTLLYFLATLFFVPGLRGGEISILYPVASSTYIWVCIFSNIILKEKINITKAFGIALIILGISLLGIFR